MRFAKDFPDELRSRILVSDIVAKKVALKKKGLEHTGLCPFHSEKTPSFTVNDQKGFYHCFGCAAHGDVITFLMHTEKINFKDAVISLADSYGIKIPYIKDDSNLEDNNVVNRSYYLLEESCKFFESSLFDSQGYKALQYLYDRGLSDNTIKKFRLGFALDGFSNLSNYLISKGFNDDELLESGILGKKNNIFDKFRDRVIFPILDKRGKVIAFGGRILGKGQPKYLNSSETKLFKKGNNLYNYFNASKEIYKKNFAVIVEGYMDTISLATSNISNVVAPLGTSITSHQLQELFKITGDIVICLDGDIAGINAMKRTFDIVLPLINSDRMVRYAILPTGLDPDDFIKHNGKKNLEKLLNEAQNLSEVLFNYEVNNLSLYDKNSIVPEKKSILESRLTQKAQLIKDNIMRKHFLQYYKDKLFYLDKRKSKQLPIVISKNNIVFNNTGVEDAYAFNIIKLLVNFPKLVNYKSKFFDISIDSFESENLSNLKDSIVEFILDNNIEDSDAVYKYVEGLCCDSSIKSKILLDNNSCFNLDSARLRLEIMILKSHYQQVNVQYLNLLKDPNSLKTSYSSLSEGELKAIVEYKIQLEKEILSLESDIV